MKFSRIFGICILLMSLHDLVDNSIKNGCNKNIFKTLGEFIWRP